MPLEIKHASVRELIDSNLLKRGRSLEDILNRFRNSVIVRALNLNRGDAFKTARMLQIPLDELRWEMRERGIDRYYSS